MKKEEIVMESTVNKKKQDFSVKLMNLSDDFMNLISQEFQDLYSYFQDKIQENVVSLLDVDKPRVMVYGIYNSGKSTLINALCKEEVAKMADRPMTDQISEYDRGDFYLVDSPGVDAPIQHEIVTEEYLNKCHVILFVISTKGLFEDRDNYIRLAKLIEKDIPFIIVLNDRGGANIGKNWTEEEKKKAKFEHEQELNIIQYKVIQNLIKESNNPKIADKYEVVVLNAKKALMGIQREKPQLYEASNIEFLDKRITQLIQSDNSIKALFMQPIGNLKECFNEIEKVITQTMSGNDSEDFSMRIHVMESKRDNIMQDLRILTQQAVYSHMEELTNSYVNGDIDIFESIANAVCVDVEDRYLAKINELLVYIDKNFSSINLYLDTMSNLSLGSINFQGKKVPLNFEDIEKNDNHEETTMTPEKKDFWDFFKSKKKKEEEKFARLEREAEIRNQQAQYRVQEQIRKKQEARQLASSDLDELLRLLNNIVSKGMNEKYNEILSQIQEVDCLNKQALENGKRQRGILKNLMEHLLIIENQLT